MKGYNMTDIIKISGNWHESAIPTSESDIDLNEDIKKKALEVCGLINNAKSICDDNKHLHDLFDNAHIDLDMIESDLYEKLVNNK